MIVTDIRMPVMDALEMAKRVKQKSPDTPVIIFTAFSEVELMVEAVDIGIDRFVQKPVEEDVFIDALYKCGLPLVQENEIENLSGVIQNTLASFWGNARQMREIIKKVRQVAATDFSVVLQGETGVGKSMMANSIHNMSRRAGQPFVKVDISSIPETLVESELFGHKKGAFTGADRDKKGFLESAGGGTIFFDDIQNMSPQVQTKLLRAVEDRKIYPLGTTTAIDTDMRIICATNVDFKKIVAQKKFREDLFYRLFEFDIHIPPLRERREDIPLLAQRFFFDTIGELNKKITGISAEALKVLVDYDWPGNVRQLKNVMRWAVLFCENDKLGAGCITTVLEPGETEENEKEPEAAFQPPTFVLAELEEWAIREVLRQTGGKRMQAAAILKIDYKRLMRKMEKYGISHKAASGGPAG